MQILAVPHLHVAASTAAAPNPKIQLQIMSGVMQQYLLCVPAAACPELLWPIVRLQASAMSLSQASTSSGCIVIM